MPTLRPLATTVVLLLAACSSPPPEQRPTSPAPAAAATAASSQPTPRAIGAAVPFTTLEAESPTAISNGQRILLTVPKAGLPEVEASGYGYVALEKTGDYLEFPQAPAANALVIRHCIPDAPAGGGTTASLGLYVNGARRQSLTLSSKHNWLYGTGKPGENGQSEEPTAFPHVFWDESRFIISGGVRAGDRIRLQKDTGDEASFYRIDLIDLEMAPDPLPRPVDSLSITDFGATGTDPAIDTRAMLACIKAAKEQGKTVWLPPGRYLQNASLPLDGVRVQGAGMWHTRIEYTEVPERWTGVFSLGGEGSGVCDLAIDGPLTRRKGPLHGFTGLARRWSVRNVWITHTNTAFWMAGDDGLVAGCRVRFTYADGININNGSHAYAHRVVVEDNHVRGCGDDCIAILCHEPNKGEKAEDRQTQQVTIRHNTTIAPWWASNCDLAGGTGHVIEDNLFEGAGLVVNLPGAYPMQPQGASIIRRNLLARCGNEAVGQHRGALWIYAGSTTIDGLVIEDNRMVRPWYKGVDIQGGHRQALTIRGNRIEEPGAEAISIGSPARGAAIISGNTASGLKPGAPAVKNNAGDGFAIAGQGNSWQ